MLMTQSNYSITEIINADVIDESQNTLLLKFQNGDVSSLSKQNPYAQYCNCHEEISLPISTSGRALLERTDIDRGGTGAPIELNIDVGMKNATLSSSGTTVDLFGRDLADALGVFLSAKRGQPLFQQNGNSNVDLGNEQATELFEIFERILQNQVREDILESAHDSFRMVDIDVRNDGWVIEDTYLLTYDGAEVYFTEDKDIYARSGSTVRDVTETKQVFGIDIKTEPLKEIDIGGQTDVYSEVEQRFLAIVQILSEPNRYLGFDTFEEEVYGAIRDATGNRSSLDRLAGTAEFSHFIDPKTGLLHKHGVNKHLAYTTFDLNYWVIRDLEYSSFDHAGVAELAWREDELRQADRDVFSDVSNDDDKRWDYIQRITEKAPCPNHVYNKLDSLYGQR